MKLRKMMTGLWIAGVLAACTQRQQQEREQIPVSEDTTFLTGTLFLVRHAEKNPGVDSTLTAAGCVRAGALYRLLKDSSISRIYHTPYKRSVQTGDSLRIRGKVDTVFYRADSTGESLLYEISRHHDWGKRILVIGHSNTLIPIMKSLSAKPGIDSIGDKDYGNLFILRKTRDRVSVERKTY